MHPNFEPLMPFEEQLPNAGLWHYRTNYLAEVPETAPCWYCGKPCRCESPGGSYEFVYFCHRHEPLTVAFFCVHHEVTPPNWFFNRLKILYRNLQLFYHFYNPISFDLMELRKGWAPGMKEWKTIMKMPPETAHLGPEKHLSIMRLARVFS